MHLSSVRGCVFADRGLSCRKRTEHDRVLGSVTHRGACFTRRFAGDNGSQQSTPPQFSDFTTVASGASHTCGLRKDGNIICWG
jgi:hypothetical protein